MADAPRVAIVGGESLLGSELRELLSQSILGREMSLVGSEEQPGVAILSEQAGEPVVITAFDESTLAAAGIVFFAGTPASTRAAMERLGSARPRIIDLTHTLEEAPGARLRAPSAEPRGYAATDTSIAVVAHPAAAMIALVLRRLHARLPVARSVAQIAEPASERGRAGVNELQQQTVDMLSFRPPQKQVFDAQLSFNLLARYGGEAPSPLEAVELRIEKHLASLLAIPAPVPMPSLRLFQAPVMHGYSISLWVEFTEPAEAGDVREALKGPGIDLYADGVEPPDVVACAGMTGIAASIEADRNSSRGFWLWLVADNFRLAAGDALDVARAWAAADTV